MDFDFEIPDLSWREFSIRKKHKPGEFRKITAPNPELKEVQRRILLYLYSVKGCRPSYNAHGFVKHRNTSTGVICHSRLSPRILCMDIKDFFDNFPVEVVKRCLIRGGVPALLVDKIMKVCTYKNTIPQGGPCSPALTNIGMAHVDRILAKYAERHNMVYTRYADDITISVKPGAALKDDYTYVYKSVNYILKHALGLHLNTKKNHTITLKGKMARRVNGIVIAKDGRGYNAPRKMRRIVRAMLCNLAHKVQAQGGYARGEDYSTWAKIVGYARYFDNIRAYSEPERATADPSLQEKYWDYCEKVFKRD